MNAKRTKGEKTPKSERKPGKVKGKVKNATKIARTMLGRVIMGRHANGMRRVAITGMGTVNALGRDVPSTLEAMREGRCGIGPLEFRDVERLAIRIGGQVRDWEAETYFNRQQIVLYDKFTQFTLLADCRKGRRPSFIAAAEPETARILYEYFISLAEEHWPRVGSGRFQAMMKVESVNDGPVTLLLDSRRDIQG